MPDNDSENYVLDDLKRGILSFLHKCDQPQTKYEIAAAVNGGEVTNDFVLLLARMRNEGLIECSFENADGIRQYRAVAAPDEVLPPATDARTEERERRRVLHDALEREVLWWLTEHPLKWGYKIAELAANMAVNRNTDRWSVLADVLSDLYVRKIIRRTGAGRYRLVEEPVASTTTEAAQESAPAVTPAEPPADVLPNPCGSPADTLRFPCPMPAEVATTDEVPAIVARLKAKLRGRIEPPPGLDKKLAILTALGDVLDGDGMTWEALQLRDLVDWLGQFSQIM